MLSNNKKTSLDSADMTAAITTINASHTLNDLINNWQDIMGFTATSYHHFPSVGSFDFKNMSRYYSHNIPDYITDYFNDNKRARADPSVLKVFNNGNSAWLSDFDFETLEKETASTVKNALEKIVDGLSIPVYGPNNQQGYMFVSFGRHQREFDPIMPHEIQSLAQRFHVRYCLIKKGLQKKVNLTHRETEVLELISFGKTNPEIAKILNISSNTVSSYVQAIFLKLETNDRVTAAMRFQSIKVTI